MTPRTIPAAIAVAASTLAVAASTFAVAFAASTAACAPRRRVARDAETRTPPVDCRVEERLRENTPLSLLSLRLCRTFADDGAR